MPAPTEQLPRDSDPAAYDYAFDPSQIAQTPARPRDAARLLVYDPLRDGVTHTTFRHLASYLPRGSVLVCNDTKVLPARLVVHKPTGGAVELLYLGVHDGEVRALAHKKITVGMVLTLTRRRYFTVTADTTGTYSLVPSFPLTELPRILARYGSVPLPPYLKHSPLRRAARAAQYQTFFARHAGSAAAPTASLHLTPRVVATLEAAGIAVCFVTLHVGLGTFAPLTPAALAAGALHAEWYDVPAGTQRTIARARTRGAAVIAVGTTVMRTLESAYDRTGTCVHPRGTTRLFIRPPYRFRVVSGLITNFHVPRSSLLMLVAALVGRTRLLALYAQALAAGYRLFSFGDAMLILPRTRRH